MIEVCIEKRSSVAVSRGSTSFSIRKSEINWIWKDRIALSMWSHSLANSKRGEFLINFVAPSMVRLLSLTMIWTNRHYFIWINQGELGHDLQRTQHTHWLTWMIQIFTNSSFKASTIDEPSNVFSSFYIFRERWATLKSNRKYKRITLTHRPLTHYHWRNGWKTNVVCSATSIRPLCSIHVFLVFWRVGVHVHVWDHRWISFS